MTLPPLTTCRPRAAATSCGPGVCSWLSWGGHFLTPVREHHDQDPVPPMPDRRAQGRRSRIRTAIHHLSSPPTSACGKLSQSTWSMRMTLLYLRLFRVGRKKPVWICRESRAPCFRLAKPCGVR